LKDTVLNSDLIVVGPLLDLVDIQRHIQAFRCIRQVRALCIGQLPIVYRHQHQHLNQGRSCFLVLDPGHSFKDALLSGHQPSKLGLSVLIKRHTGEHSAVELSLSSGVPTIYLCHVHHRSREYQVVCIRARRQGPQFVGDLAPVLEMRFCDPANRGGRDIVIATPHSGGCYGNCIFDDRSLQDLDNP
jgi:hypothetical protein